MDEEYGEGPRKDSSGNLLGIPTLVGSVLGGVVGLLIAAAADNGGMMSGLVYPMFGGLGMIVGIFVGLAVGVLFYVTRPR